MKKGITNGKKMIETISSSFSVRAIASPPSLGTTRPARKAPGNRKHTYVASTERGSLTEDCMDSNVVGEKRGAEEDDNGRSHEED